MDELSFALAIELQLRDVEEALSTRKGKGRLGDAVTSSDEVAFNDYREHLLSAARMLADERLAESLDRAVRSDGELLEELTKLELGDEGSRELAMQLSEEPVVVVPQEKSRNDMWRSMAVGTGVEMTDEAIEALEKRCQEWDLVDELQKKVDISSSRYLVLFWGIVWENLCMMLCGFNLFSSKSSKLMDSNAMWLQFATYIFLKPFEATHLQGKPQQSTAGPSYSGASTSKSGTKTSHFGTAHSGTTYKLSHQKSGARADCAICLESFFIEHTITAPCKHSYCFTDLKDIFTRACKDEQLFPPRCCKQELSIELALPLMSDDEAVEFLEKSQEYTCKDRTYCFQPSCSRFIPAENISRDVATCNDCYSRTCKLCKKEEHGSEDCPDDPSMKLTLETAAANGWQRCQQCHSLVERSHGCQHMTCR